MMYSPAIIDAFDSAMAQQQRTSLGSGSPSSASTHQLEASAFRRPSLPRSPFHSIRSSFSSLRHHHAGAETSPSP